MVGSAITSGTIGGTTAINTTGSISSGAIVSSGLITSPSLSSTAISTQSLQVFETTNSFNVTIKAPLSLGANYVLTLPTNAGMPTQVLTTNGAGLLSWSTPAGTGFMNGGNSFGANSSIGNNDNFDLTVKTSSLPRITVQAGGNVGIGTTAPGAKLDIAGQFRNSGTTPTLGSCGTSPSISGTDQAGLITMGSGALTSCTINFHAALTNAPASCVFAPADAAAAATGTTGAYVSSITTSAWVMTGSNLTSAAYYFHCY